MSGWSALALLAGCVVLILAGLAGIQAVGDRAKRERRDAGR